MNISNEDRQGVLLTATCLKSRWSWLYGQLWLFPDGLLRLPSPWWSGISQMYARPMVTPGHLESRVFKEQDFLRLTCDPKSVWLPFEQIARASLGGDAWTECLSAELVEGSVVKFFWMRFDNTAELLGKVLSGWLGSNLRWE